MGDIASVLVGQERIRKEAIVTFVSPIIDPDSGLGAIDLKLDNHDFKLQSGIVCYWNEDPGPINEAKLPTQFNR